jgi:hypothetical protein
MGKRRRRTRSDERGGRTDIDHGVRVPAVRHGSCDFEGHIRGFAAMGAAREPGYRRRLYASTLPFIGLAAMVFVGVVLLVIAVR